MLNERLKTVEVELSNTKRDANNLQNMLQQSQEQYSLLEKKYAKVKRLLRDFQRRERDMVSVCLVIGERRIVTQIFRFNSLNTMYKVFKKKTPSTMRWSRS